MNSFAPENHFTILCKHNNFSIDNGLVLMSPTFHNFFFLTVWISWGKKITLQDINAPTRMCNCILFLKQIAQHFGFSQQCQKGWKASCLHVKPSVSRVIPRGAQPPWVLRQAGSLLGVPLFSGTAKMSQFWSYHYWICAAMQSFLYLSSLNSFFEWFLSHEWFLVWKQMPLFEIIGIS